MQKSFSKSVALSYFSVEIYKHPLNQIKLLDKLKLLERKKNICQWDKKKLYLILINVVNSNEK